MIFIVLELYFLCLKMFLAQPFLKVKNLKNYKKMCYIQCCVAQWYKAPCWSTVDLRLILVTEPLESFLITVPRSNIAIDKMS